MRKTLMTVALFLVLSCTALGGEIHTPPAPEPEPAQTQTSTAQEPTATDEDSGATNALTTAALDVLAVLPSLL
jgi:hypothetical protein